MTLDRISRLQRHLAPGQLFYVSNLVNIRYLTGFTGSNAALLVTEDNAVFATDSRYEIQANSQVSDLQTLIGRNFPELLLAKRNKSEVLVEGNDLSINSFKSMESNFPHQLKISTGLVEQLRAIKDEAEINLIKSACEIATQSFLDLLPTIKVGQSEKDIRDALEQRFRELGADDIAFESIVASGPNSAIPHHEPTDRKVAVGELLKIDFGAKLNGYHSDCTRTLVIGKPADWQLELHAAVTQAQEAGRSAIRTDIKFADVEDAVIDALVVSGYREYFTHGLGHGVGLEIHEDPFFGRDQDAKIASNTVITIEPGAYLKEKGGVRVEDTIVVNSDGYLNLTNLPYELLEL